MNPVRRTTRDYARGAILDQAQQAAMIARRIEPAVMLDHEPAVIIIAVDFVRLVAFFDNPQRLLEPRRLLPRPGNQLAKLAWIVRRQKTSALSIFAFESVTGDKFTQPFERSARLLHQRQSRIMAVAAAQLGVTRFNLAANLAAVARTAAPTRILGVDYRGAAACTCGLQCTVQAGVSGADDQYVGFIGQGLPR